MVFVLRVLVCYYVLGCALMRYYVLLRAIVCSRVFLHVVGCVVGVAVVG